MPTLDPAEFDSLFANCYQAVWHYCITIIKDRQDAQDIVQRSFMKLWLNKEKVENAEARPYLYKIVYHASLDHLKHNRIRKKYEMTAVRSIENNLTADGGTGKEELESAIRRAVDMLPEQCRKIFGMSRTDGLKYREIAEALQISEKTVENQMGKALKILRSGLKEFLPVLFLIFLHSKS